VIRVLDAAGNLLGWTEVQAKARGDGRLWSPGPVDVLIDRDGESAFASVHWCDVNTETRVPYIGTVRAGQRIPLCFKSSPLVVVGEIPQGLPIITVRAPVGVGIPAGQLGAYR
jgi:hypothetical protein